jgi:hypothetical protein
VVINEVVHDDISMGVLQQGGEALGPQPVEPHSLPVLFCPRPLTFKILAATKVELPDLHAAEHLDVAWRSGVEGRCQEK